VSIKEFGDNVLSKSRTWIKAQVSFASDVLNGNCLDAFIGAYRESETKQALLHLEKLGANNLYIFDRGYFGREFLYKVYQTGSQFCFRVQLNACSEVITFIKSGVSDLITTISYQNQQIPVRISRVILKNGEQEYLVTSLRNQKRFSLKSLKELYHKRWGVEEQYKDIKHALAIENFAGKKVNSIKQEFYGTILTYNLAMIALKKPVEKRSNSRKKKYKYKANKRSILAKFKQCFVTIFFDPENLIKTFEEIIKTVTKESVPIRPNRYFERGKTQKAKKKRYKTYIPVT
jgi:hypothetical protein